jgi:hypothetical protein
LLAAYAGTLKQTAASPAIIFDIVFLTVAQDSIVVAKANGKLPTWFLNLPALVRPDRGPLEIDRHPSRACDIMQRMMCDRVLEQVRSFQCRGARSSPLWERDRLMSDIERDNF